MRANGSQQWNAQRADTVMFVFLQFLYDFWFVFFVFVVLKVCSFSSLVPSFH